MVLFKDCGDDLGEFRVPGRMFESIHNIPDPPEEGSDAELQVHLTDAIFQIPGVGAVGFEDDAIRVHTLGIPWNEIRPSIEATIQIYVAA
jgi:hypothetical protein